VFFTTHLESTDPEYELEKAVNVFKLSYGEPAEPDVSLLKLDVSDMLGNDRKLFACPSKNKDAIYIYCFARYKLHPNPTYVKVFKVDNHDVSIFKPKTILLEYL
jgi:hypothetical protein